MFVLYAMVSTCEPASAEVESFRIPSMLSSVRGLKTASIPSLLKIIRRERCMASRRSSRKDSKLMGAATAVEEASTMDGDDIAATAQNTLQ